MFSIGYKTGFKKIMEKETKKKTSLFEFSAKANDGTEVELSKYRGKVCIVVNVASKCGLTDKNYEQLVSLYKKYSNQGLEILAFPSNQFAWQEPESDEKIHEFVCSRGGEFPLFAKTTVNGSDTIPLYKFLKESLPGSLVNTIKWNFTKFLCDRDGIPYSRHGPYTPPFSMEDEIVLLLGKDEKKE